MLERRKVKRLPWAFKVEVMLSQIQDVKLKADVVDVSDSGIRLVLSSELLIGSSVVVRIISPGPDNESVSVLGDVIWTRKSPANKDLFEIGIQFSFLGDEKRRDLIDIINRRPPSEGPENKYIENFNLLKTRKYIEEDTNPRLRLVLFIAMIVVYAVVILVGLYILASHVNSTGIWGLHF